MISGNVSLMLLLCMFTPTIAMLGAFGVYRWRMAQRAERSPVSEKLLRPPGESLRLKIDELNETFGDRITAAAVAPAVMMAAVLLSAPGDNVSNARAFVAFIICAGLLLFLLWRAFLTLSELREHRLGFHGERAVGEELNQLMRDGCRVFHDVPIEPYGNIDHVIVSPAGVFAVETKARRKRPAPKGKRECDAVFDGEAVNFPTWREAEMVNQAKMQGERLRAFLTSAVGEPVSVFPILTLPGWFVTSSVPPGAVRVVNPNFIKGMAADSRAAKLTPPMIQRIAHQLEQKCRTVEL